MDLDRIFLLLRELRPRQEKVLRLYLGLGCERPHSAQEMAEELGVSVQVIAGIIGAAQRRLAQEGLTASDLCEAARHATDSASSITFQSRSSPKKCRPPWTRTLD